MLLQSGPTSLNHSELILQSSSSSSSSTTPAQSTTAHAFLNHPQAPSSITSSSSSSSTPPNKDISRYVDAIQEQLKEGWTVHTAKDGRLYYCNHITRTAHWLPPIENWSRIIDLPFGWEKAVDQKGRPYYINHLNKTTTFESPQRYNSDDPPPEPRYIVLQRSPTLGFGFVAGSEKPVIVRFVTESGPSVGKLEPGDEILSVNGEDVKDAPRDHVINLVRNCENHVELLVCQPKLAHNACGRKSTLLSAAKRNKLKTRPIRVRFAESVCVNGAPLFPPSAFSLGDICVPPMANVLKVFLENGQTKSFKYDSTTTVHDVVTSLRDKLCITAGEHFSLVLEHVKSLKRNKLTLLDPQETLARIAARPGAHKLRCLFRVTFVPVTAAELAQKDLNGLDYLFMQCCNDVIQERFAPELTPDVALRLAALHMHQHALANNMSPSKLTVKTVEREFGLERFVPTSLIDGMKRKELRRLISHFLKLNSQMTGSSTKILTQLQAKIHYLDIISALPSYGAKCFSTNQRDGVERVLLISPRFGLSQIAGVKNSVPQPICTIEELSRVVVSREDDVSNSVSVFITPDKLITFSMEDRDAQEFANVLTGYFRLLAGKELHVEREREVTDEDVAPPYLSQHTVEPSDWNYLPSEKAKHSMAFLMLPPYYTTKQLIQTSTKTYNNNNDDLMANKNLTSIMKNSKQPQFDDEFGYDMHSVVSMEILENQDQYKQTLKHYPKQKLTTFVEAKNQEVLRRVAEMQKMVENSQRYLNENGELIDGNEDDQEFNSLKKNENSNNLKNLWRETSVDIESDCESLNSSRVSSSEGVQPEIAPPPGILKHSDSLTLLAETINQDLNGINKGLFTLSDSASNTAPSSTSTTPKVQRRVYGLSQIISDLQALGNDQSESDSESLYTPNSSPIHRSQTNGKFAPNESHLYPGKPPIAGKSMKQIRTSFGLRSPDALGCETKDDLKEYLRQLKEASNNENGDHQDLAAQKLAELYGFEIGDDTMIETDPDLIDLTAIPPPQTPDELDIPSILNPPPRQFDDSTNVSRGDLEEFLKKVKIEPPINIITPAVELTPEEILSFIIPPPPSATENRPPVHSNINANENPNRNFMQSLASAQQHQNQSTSPQPVPRPRQFDNCNSFYDNHDVSTSLHSSPVRTTMQSNGSSVKSKVMLFNNHSNQTTPTHQPANSILNNVIEYPTFERKNSGAFSCCSKTSSPKNSNSEQANVVTNGHDYVDSGSLKLPPKRYQYNNNNNYYNPQIPDRPPKSAELKLKLNSPVRTMANHNFTSYGLYNNADNNYPSQPPSLPPRFGGDRTPPPVVLNTSSGSVRRPPLPPVMIKPFMYTTNGTSPNQSSPIKSPLPILKNNHTCCSPNNVNGSSNQSSPVRTAVIGSPHFYRHPNSFRDIDQSFNQHVSTLNGMSPQPSFQQSANGHNRSNSDCPPVCLKNPSNEQKPQLSLLCSPQMNRKATTGNLHSSTSPLTIPSSPQLANKNGHVISVDTLLAKTDVAMAGLLLKLDQVASMCTIAQQAGGGTDIDEEKFQSTRDELTDQSLHLVTSSKLLVMALSDASAKNLPEHLTACLTSLRRITELAQNLIRFTSAPFQTRNIILKIHDVAASFKEMVKVPVGPLGAGQLALTANCLANVLATLLRSLRVFSP